MPSPRFTLCTCLTYSPFLTARLLLVTVVGEGMMVISIAEPVEDVSGLIVVETNVAEGVGRLDEVEVAVVP